MPELPDVEYMLSGIKDYVIHKTISRVVVWDKVFVRIPERLLRENVDGSRVEEVRRRGKYIIVELSSGFSLVAHMGMSGNLFLASQAAPISRYLKVQVKFAVGKELRYTSVRKLGTFELSRRGDYSRLGALYNLGAEPLSDEFNQEVFGQLVRTSKAAVKSLLMDQRKIAGIGNIYSDEILFQAGILPMRSATELSGTEVDRLYRQIRKTLRYSIENFDSLGKKGHLLINHRRPGERCPRCGGKISKSIINSRSSYYCPRCQR